MKKSKHLKGLKLRIKFSFLSGINRLHSLNEEHNREAPTNVGLVVASQPEWMILLTA